MLAHDDKYIYNVDVQDYSVTCYIHRKVCKFLKFIIFVKISQFFFKIQFKNNFNVSSMYSLICMNE